MINVARRPDILKKIRDEVKAYASKISATGDNFKSKKDILSEILDLNATQDLDYLN